MINPTRRSPLRWLLIGLVTVVGLVGCKNMETGEVQVGLSPSPQFFSTHQPINTQTTTPTVTPTITPSPSPTLFIPAPLFDKNIDIWAGPVDVPLKINIPSLNIDIPVIGVGLTPWKVMDAPTSSLGSPFWHSAFWYRGGGIPGDVGTATIAGHITDPLGKPGAFRYLQDLHVGDEIIIHDNRTSLDIKFVVDEVRIITLAESKDPELLKLIYGEGPVNGTGPQPSSDGLSHLVLITCATDFTTGRFDNRTVIFATRVK
jgi:hypothetical protein